VLGLTVARERVRHERLEPVEGDEADGSDAAGLGRDGVEGRAESCPAITCAHGGFPVAGGELARSTDICGTLSIGTVYSNPTDLPHERGRLMQAKSVSSYRPHGVLIAGRGIAGTPLPLPRSPACSNALSRHLRQLLTEIIERPLPRSEPRRLPLPAEWNATEAQRHQCGADASRQPTVRTHSMQLRKYSFLYFARHTASRFQLYKGQFHETG
jgi:hypothetical protein